MIERGEEDFVPELDGREAVGKIRGLGSGRGDAALPHDTSAERERAPPCVFGYTAHICILSTLIVVSLKEEVGYRIHFLANFCNFFHHFFRKSFCENQSDNSTVTKISEGITEICST